MEIGNKVKVERVFDSCGIPFLIAQIFLCGSSRLKYKFKVIATLEGGKSEELERKR